LVKLQRAAIEEQQLLDRRRGRNIAPRTPTEHTGNAS